MKVIEAAFQKTLRDPDLIAEAERSKGKCQPDLRRAIAQHDPPINAQNLKEKLRPMLAPASEN